jgi:uracil-DNA glycosylase
MTRDRKRIAGEIANHLELYKKLGVRFSRSHFSSSGNSMKKHLETVPHKPTPAAASSARFIPPSPGLFSPIPQEAESLDNIRQDLGDCRRCKLAASRTHIVFGSGNPKAELMFVGEAPGADEDEQGLPFVGRAGQLLTKIIGAIDMSRDQVYIVNILKCRPPNNRNPESDEIAACEPFLFRQIAAIRPKVICALGLYGIQTLIRTKEPISRLRGQFMDYRGVKLIATFHPAYLLRNPNEKRKVWEDMRKVRDYIRSLQ